MSVIDVDKVIAPIDGDDPCGISLTDDITLMMLLERAKGTPEAVMGDSVRPAEEPDWSAIRRDALELLERTKDLWLAMLLVPAGLRLGGLTGFAEALAAVDALIGAFWDSGLHPRPDEDGDPYERLAALSALTVSIGSGDSWKIVEKIREAPLTDSRQIGRFSLRDIAIAMGESSPREDEQAPTADLIEAAFEDTEVDYLTQQAEAAGRVLQSLDSIQAALESRVDSASAPSFAPVHSAVQEVRAALAQRLERRGYAVAGGEVEDAAPEAGHSQAQKAAPGEIRSSQDVTRLLDRLIEYYVRNEPSSPVPLLLRRAQRLVSRSFMDIIRDLSPEGLDQIRVISGEREEEGV